MQLSSLYTFCLFFIQIFATKIVFCSIIGPTKLEALVGDNVTFMWNTTNGTEIRSAVWGLRNGEMADPQFINVNALSGVTITSNLSKQYTGRVEFVGNLKQGKAWFVIKNVTIGDTNEYIARISEGDASQLQSYPVLLEVTYTSEIEPEPSFAPFITTTCNINTSTYNINESSYTPQPTLSDATSKTTNVLFTLLMVITGQLIVK